jgi:flagellar motor switch protein FliG
MVEEKQLEKKKALCGAEKAAAFLLFLGEEISTEVFKELSPDEVETVIRTIPNMPGLSPDVIDSVVNEFNERFVSDGLFAEVSRDFVEAIVSKAFDRDRARDMLRRLDNMEKLENLRRHDPRVIFNLIKNEHPQTVAFVLSHLDQVQTADILARLPENVQYEVLVRIAKMDQILPETFEEVIDALSKEVASMKVITGGPIGGVKPASEILNLLKKSDSNEIMRKIEEDDPDLAEEIGQLMFVFEDMVNIDDRGIQMILKEVSNDDLAMSLKMASDEVQAKIFRNISTRAAEMIKEEMEAKGPVRISDVEKAQQVIVRVARKLEEEGKIVVAGRGGDEVFI